MTDGPGNGLGAPTLEGLITSAGHEVGPQITPFTHAAAAVQLERSTDGVSDTSQITRSTALWTLMRVDPELAAAFTAAGMDVSELGKELSVRPSAGTMPVEVALLHPDFAAAIGVYLAGLARPRRIDLADVAEAIVAAVADDEKRGLLPGRMRKLSVGTKQLRAAIERLRSAQRTAPAPIDLSEFSESVRLVRAGLGGDKPVSAAEIASKIKEKHPEYGDDVLGMIQIRHSGDRRLTIDGWLERVRDLYDTDELRRSGHPVIDGQLTLLALAELDEPLGEDLRQHGFLPALQRSLRVAPRGVRGPTEKPRNGGSAPSDHPLQSSEPTSAAVADGTATATAPDVVRQLAGGISADLVDPTEGIPIGRDRLGVGPYVSMLASVIADRKTPMPLSVGIFGEWGSGKSFFMGLLRGEVKTRADSGRRGYFHDIVQIGFNAWTYADSNLWASLGDEIFRQLAGPGETTGSRAGRIRDELADRLAQRKELAASAEQAAEETARLHADVDAATTNRDVQAADLLDAVRQSPPLRETLDRAFRQLGIAGAVAQGRALGDQLRGVTDEGAALRRSLSDGRGQICAIVAAVALLLVAVAAIIPSLLGDWVGRGGAATLAASLAYAVLLVTRVHSGLSTLRGLGDDLRKRATESTESRQKDEIAAAMAALNEAEAHERVARAQLDEVVTRVGELNRQLADLAPGRRLYSFLTERAQTGDYARHLGVISIIRRDLQELVALMDEWRRREEDDTTPRPIDRIVLYIDDLDRCPPEQVVEVLQAVHLLLAMDLFVVVVGVDPRWLLHSLRRQYHSILRTDAQATRRGDDWQVTPEDYLEKIFNVPLVLPVMTPGSLGSLLRGLAAESMELEADGPEDHTRSEGSTLDSPVNTAAGATATGTATVAPILVEKYSEIDLPEEPGRPLTKQELDLLEGLESLIQTPGEAKRMMNLYRMLRSTQDLSDASRFLGDDRTPGEFEAVIVLLGLLTAHARLLGQVLDAEPGPDYAAGGLMHQPADSPWITFATRMEPQENSGRWRNLVVGDLETADVADWRRLHAGILPASRMVKSPNLKAFRLWAPRIRCFSFVLSPLAAAERHTKRAQSGHQIGD